MSKLYKESNKLFNLLGNRLRKQISVLEETCEARTTESNHMKQLVAQMESAPGQEEQNKVQIADLKTELAKAEGNDMNKSLYSKLITSLLKSFTTFYKIQL